MNDKPNYPDLKDIDHTLYDWSLRVIGLLVKRLKVNIKLHAQPQSLQGDIFLFNHFSRFETFIPQFLIHQQTGKYSCSIASGEFFASDNLFATYLGNVGVIPHDHQRLFANLTRQIFLGQKVIIFPEGGMVKDHRVLDTHGKYNIYSRISGTRRKQHKGAAVLVQGIEIFKAAIRHAYRRNNIAQLQQWQQQLQLPSLEQLLATALKPTLIVPSNITFYPIRSSDNLLLKGVQLFTDGLTVRQTEELLIEGNILLKDTDMDLRLGEPIDPYSAKFSRQKFLLGQAAKQVQSCDDVFALHTHTTKWQDQLLAYYLCKNSKITRNQYSKAIYANVTVNISHLASVLIMLYLKHGKQHIAKSAFYTIIYAAIKALQKTPAIHLHRSLLNPDKYSGLQSGDCQQFEQFIARGKANELLSTADNTYKFLPKLREQFNFDAIRMENQIVVYSNEVEPIPAVIQALRTASNTTPTAKQLALWALDDEMLSLAQDQQRHQDPSDHKTTADPSPYLLHPKHPNGIGVLLIHGLLAQPAQLQNYARYLLEQGYTVFAPRLKGHGTSPHDLRTRTLQDWYASVQTGLAIIRPFCQKVAIIGFSTGGALALKLAANNPNIYAVITVAVPIKLMDKSFLFVPLLHGTNRILEWVSSIEGVKPFIANTPEYPATNYCQVPVKSLYEMRLLIDELDTLLPTITTPTLVLYANQDPVVHPDSSQIIMQKCTAQTKQITAIPADTHCILTDNIGGVWGVIDDFLAVVAGKLG